MRNINKAVAFTLVLLMSVSITSPAQAATTNDLRGLLGIAKREIPTSNYSFETSTSGATGNAGTTGDEKVTDEPVDEEAEKYIVLADNAKQIEGYTTTLNQLKSRLSQRIESNSTAYLIVATVDEIVSTNSTIEKLKASKDNDYASDYIATPSGSSGTNTATSGSTTGNSEYEQFMNSSFSEDLVSSISSLDYDIGTVGDAAPCIVENYFKLVTPWGFTKATNSDDYGEKLLGIDLYAQNGDRIKSQWNGIVVDLGKDNTDNLQYVKIYHGNSTFTVISHINLEQDIYIGSEVYQGKILGTAGDMLEFEPNKENHVFYQVIIDNEYTNPLLVYGSRAKSVYETWLTTHPLDNVVEQGESYYNEQAEPPEEEDTSTLEVKFPDFNKDS